MKIINAKYDGFTHEIIIGNQIFDQLKLYLSNKDFRSKICIITDKNVAGLHLSLILKELTASKIKTEVLVLNPGEKTKSWYNLKRIAEWLILNKVERNDYVISLGGGVIGDLSGFATSIVRRGTNIIHMPTTLLAQVDSSIGGKTGINSQRGKNLIGTFHHPSIILSDTSFLKTLKRREFLSGYAEAVKKALIRDHDFFSWLEFLDYKSLREEKNVINIIHKSSKIKVDLVQQDEKEKGQRALLNFGHTFAHALESANNYSNNLLHGEAVIIGCSLALKLSREYDLISSEESKRVINHFKKLNYLTEINHIKSNIFNTKNLIDIMQQDKKVDNKKLSFILLKRIGEGIISKNVNMNKVKKILTDSISFK